MMLPPHLYGAILEHCTVCELHQFQTQTPNIRESAERQLQLRFPKLTLEYILEHTTKTPLDLHCDYNIKILGEHSELDWLFVRYRIRAWMPYRGPNYNQHAYIFSRRHGCSLDNVHGRDIYTCMHETYLILIVAVDSRFYIDFWDFHSAIQKFTIVIPECVHRDLIRINFFNKSVLAPNRRAIWFSFTLFSGYVIHLDGVIIKLNVNPSDKITWKGNQLYSGNQLIYTLV